VALLSLFTLEVLLRLTAPYLGAQVCTDLFRTYSKSLLRKRPDLTLPNEGHPNPTGNRALADFLAENCRP